tara:strand:- start:2041 stop:2481 length:441 start_codon:yes stop_codon:yes gene_type:complete
MHYSYFLCLYTNHQPHIYNKLRSVIYVLFITCLVSACGSPEQNEQAASKDIPEEKPSLEVKAQTQDDAVNLNANDCISCHTGGIIGKISEDHRMDPVNWDLNPKRVSQILKMHPGYGSPKVTYTNVQELIKVLMVYQTNEINGPKF